MTGEQRARVPGEIRERLLSEPELILEDGEVMRALIAANERALGGNVVDLRGAAMERLERRLRRLEETHRSVIAAAYENIAGTNQVHRAVLALLEPTDFGGFLTVLREDLPSILRLVRAHLVLESAASDGRAPEAFADVLSVVGQGALAERLAGGRAGQPRRIVLRRVDGGDPALYGEAAPWVKSEALLRLDLGEGRLPGMLALGSEDPHQYRPGQGTDLVTFFAGVFERAIRRWLA